jgi:methyl-accepting chemotaxis protein
MLVWLVTAATAFAGLQFTLASQRSFDRIAREVVPHLGEVGELKTAALAFSSEWAEIDLAIRDGNFSQARASAREARRYAVRVESSLERLRLIRGQHANRTFATAERRVEATWAEVLEDAGEVARGYDKQYATGLARALGMTSTGPSDETTSALRVVDQHRADLELEIQLLEKLHATAANVAVEASSSRLEHSLFVQVLVVVVSLIFSALTAIGISRSIQRPLDRAAMHATAVSGGEYDTRLEEGGPVEVRALTGALDVMRQTLVDRIGRLEQMVQAMARAATRTSDSAEMLVETSITMSNADCTRAEAVDRIRSAAGQLARESGSLKRLTAEAREVAGLPEDTGSFVAGDPT